ncbi:antibiotic biosynthesis monooxygenase family protein [Cytobacillus sp. FJAT-53684]|uniref:Antibiotic biosynthesis monooxygenase family protein n=1 Tax=Cytobacillus mangrovibacter TaxID=3299024 RepID=A0ABW6JWR3_9BACI
MNIHLTSGTFDFLFKMKKKHLAESMILMQNIDNAVLLHETTKSSVFNTPRSFQVLDSFGPLENRGYVVMNNIPVTEEERPLFEYRLKNIKNLFQNLKGFLAIRILQPLKSDTYIVLTLWQNEKAYMDWEHSASYDMFMNEVEMNLSFKTAQLLIGSSYITKYFIPEEK